MKTDVKALIAALTTERNSIDRAITHLRALSPEPAQAIPVAPRNAGVVRRARRKTRTHLSAETKRAIVLRMQGASNLAREAKACAREFGGSALTIYTGWKAWERAYGLNGNVAEPMPHAEPELVAGAIQ